MTTKNTTLQEIADVLISQGPTVSGSDPIHVAKEWLGYDFPADSVRAWTEIGVWDPSTASNLVDAGMTPRDTQRAAERLRTSSDPAEGYRRDYPLADPIYAACNGDLPVKRLIDAAR